MQKLSLIKGKLTVIATIVVFWPVWIWYVRRILYSTFEYVSVIPLIAIIFFIVRDKKIACIIELKKYNLFILLMSVYIILFHYIPELVRAFLAFSIIAFLLSEVYFKIKINFTLLGLFFLSLPVIPTIDFYFGYPLRLLATNISFLLIRMSGYRVELEGTMIEYGNRFVCVDAPCSGIKMLWTGILLSFILTGFFRFTNKKTLILSIYAFIFVIAGNIIRSTLLFFTESGIFVMPEWFHAAVGAAIFISLTAVITLTAYYMDKKL